MPSSACSLGGRLTEEGRSLDRRSAAPPARDSRTIRSWCFPLRWELGDATRLSAGVRSLSLAAGFAHKPGQLPLVAHDLERLPREAHAGLGERVAEIERLLCRLMLSLGTTG